jgi:hypothetical protein
MSALTIDEFKHALPDKVKKSINQELIDQINKTLSEPEMYEAYRDNLVSYTKVMADGRFKIGDYVQAVKYVSHKLMGCSNIEAYSKTFPDKMVNFANQGVSSKDIASYVTAYNKGKLVNLIFEQTLIPSYILNQDMYQKALNVLAELMVSANSEKVKSDSAAHLLNALKMPEVTKVELDVKVSESSAIAQLRQTTMELARHQRMAIESGQMNAQDVAHSRVIEAETVECVEVRDV